MASVLVADDDIDIRNLVSYKLTHAGHEVIAVENGLAALKSVREHPVDLALLDVRMPGLSGLDVCRELRADTQTRALPVILLTARSQEADVETGFAAGADDYIVKPFSPRELISRVEAVLARLAR